MTVRDKRTFIEDFILAIMKAGNPRFLTTADMTWLAENAWDSIEKRAPYER